MLWWGHVWSQIKSDGPWMLQTSSISHIQVLWRQPSFSIGTMVCYQRSSATQEEWLLEILSDIIGKESQWSEDRWSQSSEKLCYHRPPSHTSTERGHGPAMREEGLTVLPLVSEWSRWFIERGSQHWEVKTNTENNHELHLWACMVRRCFFVLCHLKN